MCAARRAVQTTTAPGPARETCQICRLQLHGQNENNNQMHVQKLTCSTFSRSWWMGVPSRKCPGPDLPIDRTFRGATSDRFLFVCGLKSPNSSRWSPSHASLRSELLGSSQAANRSTIYRRLWLRNSGVRVQSRRFSIIRLHGMEATR
jgi:hypothetical protein